MNQKTIWIAVIVVTVFLLFRATGAAAAGTGQPATSASPGTAATRQPGTQSQASPGVALQQPQVTLVYDTEY